MRSLKLGQTKEAGSVLINETRNIIFTVIAAPQWSRATSRRARAVQYVTLQRFTDPLQGGRGRRGACGGKRR